jgi:ribosome biogenesis protein MAK21
MKLEPYDPLKREPKYAQAEGEPMWELVTLARHCHPTISLWASDLLKGELLEYPGDPLLDFGLSNFLDRISYKTPKTGDKASKHRARMATFEKPVNQYFDGEKPTESRAEEQFLHRYFEMKPSKARPTEAELNSDGEDVQLEQFAD